MNFRNLTACILAVASCCDVIGQDSARCIDELDWKPAKIVRHVSQQSASKDHSAGRAAAAEPPLQIIRRAGPHQ